MADAVVLCDGALLRERGPGLRFVVSHDNRQRPAFVVRYLGKVYAYLNECAHIPVELDFNPGDFYDLSRSYLVCATHGAYYEPDTGLCRGGPCKHRRLIALPVLEREGKVYMMPNDYQLVALEMPDE
jgi:nitrite reductase/ring-hydroxylating ferredoxin subunit